MKHILFFLLTFTTISYAQSSQDISVSLSFVKQNYEDSEPITVEMTVQNNGTAPYEFELSDILLHSLKFELRTSENELLEFDPTLQARLLSTFANPALYRKLTLFPHESFSRSFNLRNYFNLTEDTTYYVKGIFYPNPDNRSYYITSDFSFFNQIAPLIIRQQIIQNQVARASKISNLSSLLPNEVIESLFQAQKDKDWGLFLCTIDPEKLIYSFPNFSGQYDTITDGLLKIDLLDQFQRFLTVHWNLPLTRYEILSTTIEGDQATVLVDAWEKIRSTERRVRYSFTLYRNSSNAWLISSYTVLALN